MNSQVSGVLARAVLYSFLSGVAAGVIYIIIALATGARMNGNVMAGSLITGSISFAIALVFYSGFMLYFSRKYARKKL